MNQSTKGVLAPDLQDLLVKKINKLKNLYRFGAVVPLPSRTWSQREFSAGLAGKELGVPVHLDWLAWGTIPEWRQGELLNNDQRRENVIVQHPLTLTLSLQGRGDIHRESNISSPLVGED